MKNVEIYGDIISLSVKAENFYNKLKERERTAREFARTFDKHSIDSSSYNSVAEAYSTAAMLFIDTYGKVIKKKRGT